MVESIETVFKNNTRNRVPRLRSEISRLRGGEMGPSRGDTESFSASYPMSAETSLAA